MPKRSIKSTWLARQQVAALAGITADELAALDNIIDQATGERRHGKGPARP